MGDILVQYGHLSQFRPQCHVMVTKTYLSQDISEKACVLEPGLGGVTYHRCLENPENPASTDTEQAHSF